MGGAGGAEALQVKAVGAAVAESALLITADL